MMKCSFIYAILLIQSLVFAITPKSPIKSIQSLPSTKQHTRTKTRSDDKLSTICAAKETVIDTSSIKLNAIELCICGAFGSFISLNYHQCTRFIFYSYYYVLTFVATAFGDFVMHPLDTIKVFQQNGGGLNLIDTAKQIIKTYGIGGLYQGVVPYVTADGVR